MSRANLDIPTGYVPVFEKSESVHMGKYVIVGEPNPASSRPEDGLYVGSTALGQLAEITSTEAVYVLPTEQQFFYEEEGYKPIDAGLTVTKDENQSSIAVYYSPEQLYKMARMVAQKRSSDELKRTGDEALIWGYLLNKNFTSTIISNCGSLVKGLRRRRELIRFAQNNQHTLFLPQQP